MSGGVDSSVVAALLKRDGFDVVGVFMKFWSPAGDIRINTNLKTNLHEFTNRCCSSEAEGRARRVAEILAVPFYVVNVEKEFKKEVVDHFLSEYKKGNTPNPCVVCNKEIKFGILIKKALSLGANYIATGHYAQIGDPNLRKHPNAPNKFSNNSDGKFGFSDRVLLKGKDADKDQSYFLWQLNQKQLSRVLFPVGGYTKPEVRKLAKKFNLPTAQTPESQEVCFISDTTNNFLKKYLSTRPGLVVDKNGKTVGEHQGLWFYTIGQRRGLEIQQGPWFAVGKDPKSNILIVSKNEKDLERKELIAKDVNWISGETPKLPFKAQVKVRYKSNSMPSLIRANKGGGVKVIFNKPQKAITPGQSVVFYRGQELLGGGVIE